MTKLGFMIVIHSSPSTEKSHNDESWTR